MDLATVLSQTLNPSNCKQAEEILVRIEKETSQFAWQLLNVTRKSPPPANLAAAIYLKNIIKKEWIPPINTEEEQNEEVINLMSIEEKSVLKASLLECMKTISNVIMPHISESISLIALTDFVNGNWPEFLPLVSSFLTISEVHSETTIHGALLICNSLFSRYRSEFRTDTLFTEINAVMSALAVPLLKVFQMNDQRLHSSSVCIQTDKEEILEQLKLILEIFYSLSSQDIPVFFEDNFSTITPVLERLLTMTVENVLENHQKALLLSVQVSVCEFIRLYATRYEEEIGDHLPPLIIAILRLLADITVIPSSSNNDEMVGEALHVIAAVSKRSRFVSLFSNPETLSAITERILLPALLLPEISVIGEDYLGTINEAAEYAAGSLTMDQNMSPGEARRHSSEEVLRGLMGVYPQTMSPLLSQFLNRARANSDWRLREATICVQIACLGLPRDSFLGNSRDHSQSILALFEHEIFPLINELSLSNSDKGFSTCIGRDSIADISLGTPVVFLLLAALRFSLIFEKVLSKPSKIALGKLCIERLLLNINPLLHIPAALFIEKIIQDYLLEGEVGLAFFLKNDQEIIQILLLPLVEMIERLVLLPNQNYEPEILMRLLVRIILYAITKNRQSLCFDTQHPNISQSPYFKISQFMERIVAHCGPSPKKPNFTRWVWEAIGLLSLDPLNGRMLMAGPIILRGTFSQPFQEYLPYAFLCLGVTVALRSDLEFISESIPFLDMLLTKNSWQPGLISPMGRALESFTFRFLNIQMGDFNIQGGDMSGRSKFTDAPHRLIPNRESHIQAFWDIINGVLLTPGAGPLKLLAGMRLLRCMLPLIGISESDQLVAISLCRRAVGFIQKCQSVIILGRLGRPFVRFLMHLGAVGALDTIFPIVASEQFDHTKKGDSLSFFDIITPLQKILSKSSRNEILTSNDHNDVLISEAFGIINLFQLIISITSVYSWNQIQDVFQQEIIFILKWLFETIVFTFGRIGEVSVTHKTDKQKFTFYENITRRINLLKISESSSSMRLAASDTIDIPELLLLSVDVDLVVIEKMFVDALRLLPQLLYSELGINSYPSFIQTLVMKYSN